MFRLATDAGEAWLDLLSGHAEARCQPVALYLGVVLPQVLRAPSQVARL
jgi:hypothetical protein